MPVTAKLSRGFYERFGDEIANELVDWFNAVDETYQRQLKDVNDLNWARAQTRFGAFDERLDALEVRFNERLDALEVRFNERLDALGVRMESAAEAKVQRLRSELILWMFGFWTATVLPLAGLIVVLSGVFRG